ncbi:hypothetical protein FO519_003232 [Halicephalobus sp. NKZ332]|nr:hypothetical protein FO519_003232 [Halicephalobus sp. NKZ332]
MTRDTFKVLIYLKSLQDPRQKQLREIIIKAMNENPKVTFKQIIQLCQDQEERTKTIEFHCAYELVYVNLDLKTKIPEVVSYQGNGLVKIATSTHGILTGEWVCAGPKCSNINSERNYYCKICGAEKPQKKKAAQELGKEGVEKSKGMFSAEDWACAKCGNVNWARRHTCNLCNAKKNADNEERTGYGGGFMDRQEVEYKEKFGDSEEEYDEFGRKKRRATSNGESPRKVQTALVHAVEESALVRRKRSLQSIVTAGIEIVTEEEAGKEVAKGKKTTIEAVDTGTMMTVTDLETITQVQTGIETIEIGDVIIVGDE